MKIFNSIPPNAGNQSVLQGFEAVVRHACKIINGRAKWALFEIGLDSEDRQWLYEWARSLQPETVYQWLGNGQPAQEAVHNASSAAAFGTLLTVLAVESARVGLPQANDWPLPIDFTFNTSARPALFDDGDPSTKQLHAIQLAVEKLRLKRGLSSDIKQWLRETIAQQINPAETGDDLPRWIPKTIAFLEEKKRSSQMSAPVFHAVNGPQQIQIDSEHMPPDDIFGRLEARAGATTIEDAARTILNRAQEKGLTTGFWSLAELAPTDYDFIWLRVWIKQLDEYTVNYCCNPFHRFKWTETEYPFQAAFGLLLMLWISECARRNAEEGWLWRWIPKEAINDDAARKRLFNQDQPSSLLKESIEMAARRFNLRHVFGRVGAQRWIDTIFLQFGFTRRGFENRLPEWLSRQTSSQAVRSLLDPETGSAGFRELWEALRNYRQNNITRDHALKKVNDGVWILLEWVDRLLELAQTPIDSGDDEDTTEPIDEPEARTAFLSEPLLRWNPPDAPYFICRMVKFNAIGLTDDAYDIAVNGNAQTRLLKGMNGCYAAVDGEEIRISLESARATVQIIDNEGRIVVAEEVQLWPSGEDVVIFKLSNGRWLSDAYQQAMNLQASYAVLTASDLRLKPQPAFNYFNVEVRLFYLPTNWDKETRVWLEDEVLWEPFFQQEPINTTPLWMAQVQLSIDPPTRFLRWGSKINLKIRHPGDVTVTFVRYGGGPLEFSPQNGQWTRIGPLYLSPEFGTGEMRLQVGFKWNNQLHRASLETGANIIGVAEHKNGAWEPIPEGFELKSEMARIAQFKIAPPRKWESQDQAITDWALMEGDLWLKNLSRLHAPIGEVSGLGAPMTLRIGPYNATSDAMVVAQAVIDSGVIEELQKVDGELQLKLSRPIEPGDRHRIICWDVNGQIREIEPRVDDRAIALLGHEIERFTLRTLSK